MEQNPNHRAIVRENVEELHPFLGVDQSSSLTTDNSWSEGGYSTGDID